MLLQRDVKSDFAKFLVCISCLTVLSSYHADVKLMLRIQFSISLQLSTLVSHISQLFRNSNHYKISRQRPIEAYDIPNRSASYRAQSYDQNKPLFDSITSKMTASQVKNRKSKFFAPTQAKIGGETRVHQRRRKNHQFRQ